MQDYVSKEPIYAETDLDSDFSSGKLNEDLKMYVYFAYQRTIALTFTGDGMNFTGQRNDTYFVCKYYYSLHSFPHVLVYLGVYILQGLVIYSAACI